MQRAKPCLPINKHRLYTRALMLTTPWGGSSTQYLENDVYTSMQWARFNNGVKAIIDKEETVYHFTVQRYATLKNLAVNETLTPEFDPLTTEYRVYVPADGAVDITATGYLDSYTVTLNG